VQINQEAVDRELTRQVPNAEIAQLARPKHCLVVVEADGRPDVQSPSTYLSQIRLLQTSQLPTSQ
jgi:hypothetical protein